MPEWTYSVVRLTWQKRRTGGFSNFGKKAYVFRSDDDYTLEDGLARMGAAGYELIAVHPEGLEVGGDDPHEYHPDYIYIFKKPKELPEESKS